MDGLGFAVGVAGLLDAGGDGDVADADGDVVGALVVGAVVAGWVRDG